MKDPEASWADWRVRLAKDPQGVPAASQLLPVSDPGITQSPATVGKAPLPSGLTAACASDLWRLSADACTRPKHHTLPSTHPERPPGPSGLTAACASELWRLYYRYECATLQRATSLFQQGAGCSKLQQVAVQGRFNNEALDRRQAEAIFREHLGSLQKRIVDGYIALLEEVDCHPQPVLFQGSHVRHLDCSVNALCVSVPAGLICTAFYGNTSRERSHTCTRSRLILPGELSQL